MEHTRSVPHMRPMRARPVFTAAAMNARLGYALDYLRAHGWSDSDIWATAGGNRQAVIDLASKSKEDA